MQSEQLVEKHLNNWPHSHTKVAALLVQQELTTMSWPRFHRVPFIKARSNACSSSPKHNSLYFHKPLIHPQQCIRSEASSANLAHSQNGRHGQSHASRMLRRGSPAGTHVPGIAVPPGHHLERSPHLTLHGSLVRTYTGQISQNHFAYSLSQVLQR